MHNIAKLKQDHRVAKKRGGRGRELTIKILSKLPGRDQLVFNIFFGLSFWKKPMQKTLEEIYSIFLIFHGNGVGCSFKNRSFKNLQWLPHQKCQVMRDGMRGILKQVRLGQVRKSIKSSIIRPSLLFMSIFQNSEKNRQINSHPGGVR